MVNNTIEKMIQARPVPRAKYQLPAIRCKKPVMSASLKTIDATIIVQNNRLIEN